MNTNHTHIARIGSDSITFAAADYDSAVAELVARNGGGVPQVAPIGISTGLSTALTTPTTVTTTGVSVDGEVNESGKTRAMLDELYARTAGFAPKAPVYSIGTRVNSIGVENARQSQLDHASKPLARDAAIQLRDVIRAEDRRDLEPLTLGQIKLSTKGAIVADAKQDDQGRWFGGRYLGVDEDAFRRLVTRAVPADGAPTYLSSCPSELRAKNFNFWSGLDDGQKTHVLRTRLSGGHRVVFAAVSERYTPFDGDKIAKALAMSFPEDARGSLDYDGQRYRVEGLWHSDVAPEEYVAGEIFKAGVIVRGSDDGSGSIRVQSVIWRNLCRNLIILDRSIGVDVRIRHTGSVPQLAATFQDAFAKALTSVESFRSAWGAAMHERGDALVAKSAGTTSHDITGLPASKVLAGLFNGILERELVKVPGRTKDLVPKLLTMHARDEAADAYGVSRASIVNAFTRYAHEIETDAFVADTIREGAGSLLTNGRRSGEPEPIPYIAFDSF
jgi:hypothetical protein